MHVGIARAAKEAMYGRCLHELFETQADRCPDGLALLCDDHQWSYRELEQRSNQLARLLRARGLGPGKLVGLLLRRSERSVVAILATLKAGAAYVPLDPSFPDQRLKHIIQEAEVALIVTEQASASRVAECFAGESLVYELEQAALATQSTERLTRSETGVAPDDLCYVLYTSGTTGRPKGVMTEHRNVVEFTDAFNEVCQISSTDRVYHGFALGFDGSVEEMGMAFSNGACLVVGTTEIAQLGNEATQLFVEKGVTVFSTVPTCLGMLHDAPPALRLVIVSGEPCPPALVEKWAKPGRRMLNVYGPTETTVNATVAECVAGQPVTIGRPLRGYETFVLDPEMQPVSDGEAGELYIGGKGLARGYLGQLEMTQRHFVEVPVRTPGEPERLYRTGDLVRWSEQGELVFLGRIDRQVKIRGYRIELAEIESVLREHAEIDQAVVNVLERDGRKELAAYIVPRNGRIDHQDVARWMRERTPSYMLPSYLDELDRLPLLPSGKVDRNRLPAPSKPLVSTTGAQVRPSNPLEELLAELWTRLLNIESVSVEDDFFVDLGGYSLLAAELASAVRKEHGLDLSIREVYSYPTIRKLAKHLAESREKQRETAGVKDQAAKRPLSREVFARVPRLARWACVGAQGLALPIIYTLYLLPLLVSILLAVAVAKAAIAPLTLVWLLMGVVFVAPPLGMLLTIAVKWVVIGRYRAGEYPLWGIYYFRWWLVSRMQILAWTELYHGTPLINLYFRLMGAKVGRNSILDATNCVAYDLLTVGEDTCIGAETQFLGYRVEEGMLKFGTIKIGSRCFVGTQSALGLNTEMGDDARLDDLSLLADGQAIPAGEGWRGSPAARAEVCVPLFDEASSGPRHPFLFGMLHFIACEVIGEMFLIAATLPLLLIVGHVSVRYGLVMGLLSMAAALPFCLTLLCVFVAGLKTMIMPRTKCGVYPMESWRYLRQWSVDLLLRISGDYLCSLYTTIYFPMWLRMLGARVGARAEISTVVQITPDLVEIGEESFFADGSIIGGRRLFRGHFELGPNRIGRRSFVGNSAVLPIGYTMGDNALLGVLSTPTSDRRLAADDGSEWIGSPPFRLPNRPKIDSFDASTTFRPTFGLYALRCMIDGVRVLLPFYTALVLLGLYAFAVVRALFGLPPWAFFALLPAMSIGVVVLACLNVIAVKQFLMGVFKPVVKPLWCSYVWSNELVNGYYEAVCKTFAMPLLGTPFIGWFLRGMGCQIGRRAFIETDLFSEFDLVRVGDYAALGSGVIIQNHLFEDRVMKSSFVTIADDCSVGEMSVVLYDTEVQQGASIRPLSLVMKGETLPEHTRWIGIPIQQQT
ncbi:MAG: amino acid adenylation domain-containing protein [Pirellulales bacterium]|nr:amino acid adenylation domain-containing protein [Pirellulales bacterium]